MKKYELIPEKDGERLDKFLSSNCDLTRSRIKNLIDDGCVTVNSKSEKASYCVRKDDKITIEVPQPKQLSLEPQNIALDIVYQDDYFAVINKPQGMVVHPGGGSYDNTLVNALLYQLKSLSSINGVIRPGIVHRLDKNTSGLLVVAKNDEAHLNLQKQIANKDAKRYYKALVDGVIKQDNGIIQTYIDRSYSDRKKMAVTQSGREAITLYTVLQRYRNYTLVEYELKTGRTHQIRVHSKYINHCVVGDDVYGGSNKFRLKGQLLHAYKLVLTHPKTGEIMTFTAELPDYFQKVLDDIDKSKI